MRGSETTFAEFLKDRFKHEDASTGFCAGMSSTFWNQRRPDAGGALTKLLRPEGALLAFFTTVGAADARFSKYMILGEDSLKQRPYSSGGKRQTALQNRDIIRMFGGLKVSESFLLKTNIREFLFRKPATELVT